MRGLVALTGVAAAAGAAFTIDADPCMKGTGACRALDGIGGLSGGGATSVYLPYYPEPQRSEVLDYLFKPNFGASLHVLKVEIGGDAQSTDGAESSHQHDPWETPNFQRGYEWWLLAEAKKRNPNIATYGLSWAFPQWISCNPGTLTNCSGDPYSRRDQTANYIKNWVAGAKSEYGVSIDYVGSWNERAWDADYLKLLRSTLDAAGFTDTKVVAPDAGWDIAGAILTDPELASAVHAIGCHYPGMHSSAQAVQTGKPLWASEDDSTYNNDVGAGCWARVINRNYVEGNMTLSMNWNLVTAYPKGTNWYKAGIFDAMHPWNGHYGSWTADGSWTVGPMVWATAHTTQFTAPGWLYTLIGNGPGTGSGNLAVGGTYVSLVDPTGTQFTMVIEKMSRNHSSCVRPGLPNYVTEDETAVFQLAGALKTMLAGKTLQVWLTHWAYAPGDKTTEFTQQAPLVVGADGSFSVSVPVDTIITLSTVTTAVKGAPPALPPSPVLFPAAHTDDFEGCAPPSEAAYFSDQNGVFECVASGDPAHGTVMRQMIPLRPITWGGDIRPHSLIGHRDAVNMSLVVDGYLEAANGSVLLGVHMQGTDNSAGLIWSADTTGAWWLHRQISDVDKAGAAIATGTLPSPLAAGVWHTYRLDVNGTTVRAWMDGTPVGPAGGINVAGYATSGHGAIGTREYGHYTHYDNFQLYSAYTPVGRLPLVAGSPVSVVNCASEVGASNHAKWDFNAATPGGYTGSMSLRSDPTLCLAANASWWLTLAPCKPGDAMQTWSWTFDGIAPDSERKSSVYLAAAPGGARCIDIYSAVADICAPLDAYACNGGSNQAFWYDFDLGEIGNEAFSVCVGVCLGGRLAKGPAR